MRCGDATYEGLSVRCGKKRSHNSLITQPTASFIRSQVVATAYRPTVASILPIAAKQIDHFARQLFNGRISSINAKSGQLMSDMVAKT